MGWASEYLSAAIHGGHLFGIVNNHLQITEALNSFLWSHLECDEILPFFAAGNKKKDWYGP